MSAVFASFTHTSRAQNAEFGRQTKINQHSGVSWIAGPSLKARTKMPAGQQCKTLLDNRYLLDCLRCFNKHLAPASSVPRLLCCKAWQTLFKLRYTHPGQSDMHAPALQNTSPFHSTQKC